MVQEQYIIWVKKGLFFVPWLVEDNYIGEHQWGSCELNIYTYLIVM